MSQPVIISLYPAMGFFLSGPLFFLLPILTKRKKRLIVITTIMCALWLTIHYQRELICEKSICFDSIKWHLIYMSAILHTKFFILPCFAVGLIFKGLFRLFRLEKFNVALGMLCYVLCVFAWFATSDIRQARMLERVNATPSIAKCPYDDRLRLAMGNSNFLLPSIGSLRFEPDNKGIGQNPNVPSVSHPMGERGWVEASYKMSGGAFLRKFCEKYSSPQESIQASAWIFSFDQLINEVWKERYTKICKDDRAKLWPPSFCTESIRHEKRKLRYSFENCERLITIEYREMVQKRGYTSTDYCADSEKVIFKNYPSKLAVYMHTAFDDEKVGLEHEEGTTYRLSKNSAYSDRIQKKRNRMPRNGVKIDKIFVTKKWHTPNGDPFAMSCTQLKNEDNFSCLANFVLKDRLHVEYAFRVSEKTPLEDAENIYNNVIDFIKRVTVNTESK